MKQLVCLRFYQSNVRTNFTFIVKASQLTPVEPGGDSLAEEEDTGSSTVVFLLRLLLGKE